MTNRYLSAKEVAGLLGIAESTAYAVIREWNKELKSEGYFTKASSIQELTLKRSATDLRKRNR